MRTYRIEYSLRAREDLTNLFNKIFYTYNAPRTAYKYIVNLLKSIECLHTFPKSFAYVTSPILSLQYGGFVRSINYKSEVILYTVYEEYNMVWIHRVAPAATLAN